ncbi:MAG: ribosome maturation factor RimM [Acetobacteraceae bacterium]
MARRLIEVAVIGRPHGVAGLVHVTSHTSDPDALAGYVPLEDEGGQRYRLWWAKPGIARLFVFSGESERPIEDRTAAACLLNRKLFVARALLPTTAADEFYLADLIGLAAFDLSGAALGKISAVHDYGAGASLEIGPLVVPFTRAAVPEIDLGAGRIVVAPPPEIAAR